ncbi:MAG: OmpA family protein [Candidatus Tectomicrobia bacterium]|nr:OmpA family protein [Candidatus Tectomicrobia bacterium]
MTQRAMVILGVVVVGLLLALASLTTKKIPPLSQATPASAQEVQKQGETPSSNTERVQEADAAAELQRLQHANQQLEDYIQFLLGEQQRAEAEAQEGRKALTAAQTSEQQAQQSLTGLQQQLRDTQERHQTATDTLKAAQDQLQQCTTAAQTAKADAAESEQQNHEAHAQEVQSLQATLTTAQEEHQSVQQALALSQQKLEECTLQARAALEQATQQHQQALEANQREMQTVQATLTTTEQSLERTKQELQAVHQQRGELQERYQDVSTNLDTTQQHLRALMAQVEEENALRQVEQDKEAQLSARLEGVHDQFVEQLRNDIQNDTLTVQQNGDHVLVRMAGAVVFTQGMASVRPEGRKMLRKISRILQNHPDYEVHVEGHSDNLPLSAKMRERWGTNWGLSAARAASVIHCLQLLGVPPDHLSAKGYGAIRPLVNHDTPEGRRQNRRIEIIVQPVKPS